MWVCVCWGVPHTNTQFSDTSRVPCNLTQLWCHRPGERVPQAKGSVLQDSPQFTWDACCESRVSPGLLTDLLQTGGSHDLLGFISFASGAHRTQRNSFPTRWMTSLLHKDRTEEQAVWRDAQGEVCGKGAGLPALCGPATLPTSPRVYESEALWLLCFGVFMEASLYRRFIWSLATGDWFQPPTTLPSLEVSEGRKVGGPESSNPLIQGWFPWQPAPILRCFPKVVLLT